MTAWKDKRYAGLVELADAVDSKSTVGDNMRVQIPSPALKPCKCNTYRAFCCYIPLRYGDYYE